VSEHGQIMATQISQNMQQPHSTVQNTENRVIIVHRFRDIKYTAKTRCEALMLVAIQERDLMVTSQKPTASVPVTLYVTSQTTELFILHS
jgi:hypothetical protein